MKRIVLPFVIAGALVARADTWDLTRLKVVLPENPNKAQLLGAEELKTHLRMITGVEGTADGRELVFAPPPGETAKDFEAHYRVVGERIHFWGDDVHTGAYGGAGSLFAVYDFLTRRLGVDWAYPGEGGIVFARRRSVEIPDADAHCYSPRLVQSKFRNYYGAPKLTRYNERLPEWLRISVEEAERMIADNAVWFRRHMLWTREYIPYGHHFTDWYDRFHETHPEYLCQARPDSPERGINDKRDGFFYGKLCVSNEGVVDQVVADWVAEGKRKYMNVCENDGYNYCRCERCCALDVPREGEVFNYHKTDRYLNFWNRIAAKAVAIRPDVVLSAYIYSDYRLPPRREKVAYPENMFFGMVPALTDDFKGDCEAWHAVGMRHFFLRPNYHAYWGTLPRGCEKAIYDNFQEALRFGIVGVDYDGYPGRYPTRPEYYITARMIVDPDGRFEDFMRDYCAAYGEAADVVYAYFARIRERGERLIDDMRRNRGNKPSDGTYHYTTVLHTSEELQGDSDLLERAAARMVFAQPEAEARFLELRRHAAHYVLTAQFYEAVRAKDVDRREELGCRLLNQRRNNFKALWDVYPNTMGSTFASGEGWYWKECSAYSAAMSGVDVRPSGVTGGWKTTFDTGKTGWWSRRDAFDAITNDTTAAGNLAVRLKTGNWLYNGLSVKTPVTPGRKYRFSGRFRAENGAKAATLRVLYVKGEAGVTKEPSAASFPLTDAWQEQALEFDVPEGICEVLLYVFVGEGGEGKYVWCDDLSIFRGDK